MFGEVLSNQKVFRLTLEGLAGIKGQAGTGRVIWEGGPSDLESSPALSV